MPSSARRLPHSPCSASGRRSKGKAPNSIRCSLPRNHASFNFTFNCLSVSCFVAMLLDVLRELRLGLLREHPVQEARTASSHDALIAHDFVEVVGDTGTKWPGGGGVELQVIQISFEAIPLFGGLGCCGRSSCHLLPGSFGLPKCVVHAAIGPSKCLFGDDPPKTAVICM